MQVLTRIGIVALIALPGIVLAAGPTQPDYAKIERQLRQQAVELRNVAKSMQEHARKPLPTGFDNAQKASIAAKRRDLEAAAADALKLANQVEDRANKARRKKLSRADMNSLGAATDALDSRIKRRRPGVVAPKTLLRESPKLKNIESDPTNEEVRNKRQEFQTMFENFDQKANQFFNILTTVMKSMKETKATIVRNIN